MTKNAFRHYYSRLAEELRKEEHRAAVRMKLSVKELQTMLDQGNCAEYAREMREVCDVYDRQVALARDEHQRQVASLVKLYLDGAKL